jgi:hypothetical protein
LAQGIQHLRPPVYHLHTFVPEVRPRIGAADTVAFDVGELRFDGVRVPKSPLSDDEIRNRLNIDDLLLLRVALTLVR